MSHWVTHPSWDYLRKSEQQNAYQCAFCRACDKQRWNQHHWQSCLTSPNRLEQMLDLIENNVVLFRLFWRFRGWNDGKRLEDLFSLLRMKAPELKKQLLEVLCEVPFLLLHIFDKIESSRVFMSIFRGVVLNSLVNEGNLLWISDGHSTKVIFWGILKSMMY